MCPEGGAQHGFQVRNAEGLFQQDSGLADGTFDGRRLGIAAREDDREVGTAYAQDLGHLSAIHPRHGEIDEYEVRTDSF